MKLTSKKIQVGNVPLNASWSMEAVNDLMVFGKHYEYLYENDIELSVVQNFFRTTKSIRDGNIVYFFMDKKELRKIKLYIISQDEHYELLLKIISNSKLIDNPAIYDMEHVLTTELTKSINEKIISRLMNLGK